MKLLSIRLHPFGGTVDRTCRLHDGVNVLEGPNEFGKSTLKNAIWHALFTSTKLTPGNLKKTLDRWHPKPDGDHLRVSLQFHADGQIWTLQKTWGSGASSSLQAEGKATIADPDQVQARLNSALKRNQATWQHVLFTGQAELTETLKQLRENGGSVDDVQTLLAGAAAIPGDILPEKLTAELESRIEAHFSRWDSAADGPERGRGIDSPWANGIGPLLAACYAQEKIRRAFDEVFKHEKAVDDINGQIQVIAGHISIDDDFVRTGRTLRDGLGKRGGLEERCQRLDGEVRLLRDTMVAWPGAAQVIQGKESELTAVDRDFNSVEGELKNARKRGQAEQIRIAHGHIIKARDEWEGAVAGLGESKAIAPEFLTELKHLEKEIAKHHISIAAQKLTAKLASATSLMVKVQRGVEAPETLSLTPSAPWESQADGIFRLEFQDLTLSVESGTGDVNALFKQLETAESRQEEILQRLGHATIAAAEQANSDHQRCVTEESAKEGIYHATLQGRSEEEWATDMAAIADIPETRSVDVLEAEKNRWQGRKAGLELEIRQERGKIGQWEREHIDIDTLTDKILTQTAGFNQAKQELAGLPALPDGFTTTAEYLELLSQKEAIRSQREDELGKLKVEKGRMEGATPNSTAEELRADLEIKKAQFERQRSEGKSLRRIQAKLQAVLEERGTDDPLQGLASAISNHFRALTAGRYEKVTLEGTAPTRVGGAITLDASLLSQGTLGSLAFATRLALSELYLKDLDGFFLLDDPFTEMDATRRAAAIQAIGTFAEKHQVLFFTCHPDHATELRDHAGAKSLQMSS